MPIFVLSILRYFPIPCGLFQGIMLCEPEVKKQILLPVAIKMGFKHFFQWLESEFFCTTVSEVRFILKSLLPFRSCWNARILHNLSLSTNHISSRNHELSNQSILSSRHRPQILFHSILPLYFPLLPSCCSFRGGSYSKQSHKAIFKACSHKFIFFWLRKASVSVRTFQLSFLYGFMPSVFR